MKEKSCKEKKKILNSFGKTSFLNLSEQQWDVLLEHVEKCENCRKAHESFKQLLKQLLPHLTKHLVSTGKIKMPDLSDEKVREEMGLELLKRVIKKRIKEKK